VKALLQLIGQTHLNFDEVASAVLAQALVVAPYIGAAVAGVAKQMHDERSPFARDGRPLVELE